MNKPQHEELRELFSTITLEIANRLVAYFKSTHEEDVEVTGNITENKLIKDSLTKPKVVKLGGVPTRTENMNDTFQFPIRVCDALPLMNQLEEYIEEACINNSIDVKDISYRLSGNPGASGIIVRYENKKGKCKCDVCGEYEDCAFRKVDYSLPRPYCRICWGKTFKVI